MLNKRPWLTPEVQLSSQVEIPCPTTGAMGQNTREEIEIKEQNINPTHPETRTKTYNLSKPTCLDAHIKLQLTTPRAICYHQRLPVLL